MKLDRLVVGVDGSANGRFALEWATGLASATGAEVVAVHALGLLERYGTDEPIVSESHRDEIRRRFETDWCAPLAVARVPARLLLRDGGSADVLLALADEVDADLIVVGSRGLGGPELLLGSTSLHVAQHCHRPVVIVPGPRSETTTH